MSTANKALEWQSKAVLLLVVPWTVASVALEGFWWATHAPVLTLETLSVSVLFGLIVWKLRAATPGAALAGAAITASLMFSTASFPYEWSWLHSALIPLLAVFVLTFIATRIGKAKKDRLGTGESKRGRNAAQVSANLGAAALVAFPVVALTANPLLKNAGQAVGFILGLAALAEAAADTVSSEMGQVFGGQPRLITSFRVVAPGTDGGITVFGTIAGACAALLVVVIGFWSAQGTQRLLGDWPIVLLVTAGAVFGLLFDSLLGATLERRGWLNNDAVNFLSTLSAVAFIFAVLVLLVFRLKP
jgi:uncharacterized protein (TIGR00297 family)